MEKERYKLHVDYDNDIYLIDNGVLTAGVFNINTLQNFLNQLDARITEREQENQQLKHSQKQLALEKLEKIKNYFNYSDDDKYADSEGWTITNRTVVEYVDNQIKELRKEQ